MDSITCPVCGRTSYNPNDIKEGYCGHCHDWTSPPRTTPPKEEQ
jgi:ribosomal protein L37E